jgi:hypothetical protein
MALTHDGLQTPLPPNRAWQLGGLAALAAGIWLGVSVSGAAGLCPGLSLGLFGLLVLGDQLGGVTRVRVTHSKLLVEHERPVRGFLIGPIKDRIPWKEFQGVEVAGGQVIAKGTGGQLELGKGQPESDLTELARKIRDAAERFARESE